MKKVYVVNESNMSDGVDVKHLWASPQEAIKSGRFEYMVENGDEEDTERYEELCKCQTFDEFFEICDYFFTLEDVYEV